MEKLEYKKVSEGRGNSGFHSLFVGCFFGKGDYLVAQLPVAEAVR